MKYIFFLLSLLLFFSLSGEEKYPVPLRVTLLYKGVPGKLFSRIRPPSHIRLTIREAAEKELQELSRKLPASPVIFLAPEKLLPSRKGLCIPYALSGTILTFHSSNPLENLSPEEAGEILKGKKAFWQEISGATSSGRITLYGTEKTLPFVSGKKAPLLITAPDSRRAAELLLQDPRGIAFLPLSFQEEKNLHFPAIGKISPTWENLISGKYPFTTRLALYIPPFPENEKKNLMALKALLESRNFHIELLYAGFLPLPPSPSPAE